MTESQSRWMIIGAVAVLGLFIVKLRFCYPVSLPAKPPEPQAPTISSADAPDVVPPHPEDYRDFLIADARRYRVANVALEKMAKVLPYTIDKERAILMPGSGRASVERAGLRLTVSRRDGSAGKMLVMSINNLTDHHLAYRVNTMPTRGAAACRRKQKLSHNAMAIRAQGTVVRSECGHKSGAGLRVISVETIILPELSYYYVSAVSPASVGLDPRPTDGHVTPDKQAVCSPPVSAALRYAMNKGATSWRDMIDFYARHRCSEYKFATGYTAFESAGERALPVVKAN